MNASKEDSLFHYHLRAEPVQDEYGPAVMLTQQEGVDDPNTILVHPWQLRAACEYLGILANDPELEREQTRMRRRLRSLAERIDQLNDYLQAYGATEYVNLKFEQAYAQATADLAAEFMADLLPTRVSEPEQGVLL